ncbi:MAG TPA: radical SAM protein [Anaeromyxobacteraceae bacterium]|nr:radical SAM protein [Anaeromyxobacteraceae bacterium]
MSPRPPSPMVRGRLARAGTALRAARIAFHGRPPGEAAFAVRQLVAAVRRRHGFDLPLRRVRAGGRIFVDPAVPGWPSPALDRFLEGELERIAPTRPGEPPLHLAILAVTRRCGLRCLHCSDADLLGTDEAVPVPELVRIAGDLVELGASNLELTGGEPMLRLDAVEAVARAHGSRADVWVLTSGVGLDPAAAERLRSAGVTGAMVSIDHWEPERHDAFRGARGTFERATAGVRAAAAAGLVAGISFTATREVGASDLDRMAWLGRDLGAGFLRILEPRAVGRWAGQDVALRPGQVDLLLRFARTVNARRSDLPVVELPALGQRTVGCSGGGDRFLFVDAEGRLHACPFCRGQAGSARGGALPEALARLRARGCHAFPDASPVRLGRGVAV